MTTPTHLDVTLQQAGFALLNDRAFLRITGPDATRWLNGMVTNATQALAPGEGNYNFLLNAQGRIQADAFLYRTTDQDGSAAFLLVTDKSQIDATQAHLDKFIIMDDVDLSPALTENSSLLLLGPEAPQHLRSLGLPAPEPLRIVDANTIAGPLLLFTPPFSRVPAIEVRAEESIIRHLVSGLQERRVPELSAADLEGLRVLAGTPRMGFDIRDRELPQETSQMHALHFAKGCYLGQEIVERIHSRGQVHRHLTPLRLEGTLPDQLPTPLEAQGKPIGEITSAVAVQLDGVPQHLALGYVRREALDARIPLQYPGGLAHLRPAGQAS